MLITPPHSADDCRLSHRKLALRLGIAALAVLFLTLPLAHVTALRSAGLVVAVMSAGFLYLSAPQDEGRTLPLLWVFLLWLAAAMLSLSASPQPLPALTLIGDEIVKSALVFYTAYFLARTLQNGATWFFPAAAALFLLASLSIESWFTHGKWLAVNLVPALGDYNTSALTLLPLIFLPVFAHWRQQLGRKALAVAILTGALSMLAAALSLSRAFWLVAAVMLASGALVWTWKRQRGWQSAILWSGGGLCVLALSATLVASWRGFDLFFFASRSVIYGPVLIHLQDAPFTGFGYGHESSKAWYASHMGEAGVLHAHNIVLSYAEQMGLLGVLSLFAIFGGLAARFFRRISDGDAHRASLATIGLALVAGIFVKNNLDIFFTRHNLLLFFLCCGVLLGAAEAGNTVAPGSANR